MRFLAMAAALLVLTACGGSGGRTAAQSSPLEGAWLGAVSDTQGHQTLAFDFQMGDCPCGSLTVSGLHMIQASACFGADSTMTAQMAGGMMGGGGTMTLDLWSGPGTTGNHLHVEVAMNGTMNRGTGSYTLTGVTEGCLSATGTFTMTHK